MKNYYFDLNGTIAAEDDEAFKKIMTDIMDFIGTVGEPCCWKAGTEQTITVKMEEQPVELKPSFATPEHTH